MSNFSENEHFLRFNSSHNCWKETKLSAVNIQCIVWKVSLLQPTENTDKIPNPSLSSLFFFFLELTLFSYIPISVSSNILRARYENLKYII